MLVGILCSRIRVEEKLLFEALKAHGTAYEKLDDRTLIFDLHDPAPFRKYDLILERAINHSRAQYALQMLNDWGIKTINTAHTARVCGDKLLTTQALRQHNLPVPRNLVAFTPESALEAIEQLGYPVVLKPCVGSWGRLVAKINDRQAAEAVLEHKQILGSYHPFDLLHSGVHRQAGIRHSLLRCRRRNDLRHLPHLRPLDHQHGPGRQGVELPRHAGD